MNTRIPAAILLMLLTACGAGGGDGETEELFEEQSIALDEMAEVLAGITDVPSLQAAKPRMQDLGVQMAALQDDWEALGKRVVADGATGSVRDEWVRQSTELAHAQARLSSEFLRIATDPELAPHMEDLMRDFGDAFDRQ